MSGKGTATRFGAPTRAQAVSEAQARRGEPVALEIALERLIAEATEAILSRRRSLARRLEIARALQILQAASAKPEPEDWEQQQAREIERIRQKRGGSDE